MSACSSRSASHRQNHQKAPRGEDLLQNSMQHFDYSPFQSSEIAFQNRVVHDVKKLFFFINSVF